MQTVIPIPVFCNSSSQTTSPDDNTVFVESIKFLLHAEMDQPLYLPVYQCSINEVPERFWCKYIFIVKLLFPTNQIHCAIHYSNSNKSNTIHTL